MLIEVIHARGPVSIEVRQLDVPEHRAVIGSKRYDAPTTSTWVEIKPIGNVGSPFQFYVFVNGERQGGQIRRVVE